MYEALCRPSFRGWPVRNAPPTTTKTPDGWMDGWMDGQTPRTPDDGFTHTPIYLRGILRLGLIYEAWLPDCRSDKAPSPPPTHPTPSTLHPFQVRKGFLADQATPLRLVIPRFRIFSLAPFHYNFHIHLGRLANLRINLRMDWKVLFLCSNHGAFSST
jgi:hypothetical protein